MSSNKIIDINISIDDENYLKNLIIKFRNNIIKSYDFENFEKISTNWIKTSLESNDKDPEIFLKIMENHKENKSWFTSLIGYFYQFGIGCNLNREKALDCYLIAINNNINYDSLDIINKNQLPLIVKNNGVFSLLRNSNTIIGKYLLSLFYYKDFINNILSVTDFEQNKLVFLLKLDGNSELEVQFNLTICRKDGNVDYKKVFELLLSLAEKKNLDAKYNLAICYMDGIGTQKDKEKAFDLFLESAIQPYKSTVRSRLRRIFKNDLESAISNNSIAQYRVAQYRSNLCGSCYECGKGTDKNEIEAFKWYLKSAEKDVKSQSYIGYCYLKGYGIDKNETKAFKWYLKSAKNGDAMSQNNVGYCYDHGIGIDKDETKAFEWYTKSAIKGCNDGQYNLGYCYENGKGTDKNEIKAFEWYTKAAEYNNTVAQNNLGDCYKYGKGTDKDEKKAFEWYLISAEQGYKMGQNNVGYCYKHGCGTGKNQDIATQWFQRAAKSAVAQNNLQTCKYGVEIAIKDLL
ncbi:kinase-like domain-containing protein [Rhizophagus irregularis DAOM 181602=DAOM 197198]|uniref:Skt5p n=1 Tax=Rhizophagus irregularis (strain DAOM 197198w) TaxID=1432141 RepID=A0A015LDU9_RHIIW|nr:Skt5p [Rhizophagus irregularis DAOM 197198w]GBC28091.1 kinase-like domain-containing protein [Rhizophagus irregularis DAOM 181602=DAOM 197198]